MRWVALVTATSFALGWAVRSVASGLVPAAWAQALALLVAGSLMVAAGAASGLRRRPAAQAPASEQAPEPEQRASA